MQLCHILLSHSPFWSSLSSQSECQQGYIGSLSNTALKPTSWQQRAGGEGQWEHQQYSTHFPRSHHRYCACSISLSDQVLATPEDRQIFRIAGSPFPLFSKSLPKKHRTLRLIPGTPNSLLEELKPCSGIKPIPSRDRKVLGRRRTFTQYLSS